MNCDGARVVDGGTIAVGDAKAAAGILSCDGAEVVDGAAVVVNGAEDVDLATRRYFYGS